ncbi:MAG TPA: sigma-54 dependent transcriptional regulator [Bryobacterales bacterium]|nr:sigma-54 dependent transcriptional regulator [Bryobacterales bacterium]
MSTGKQCLASLEGQSYQAIVTERDLGDLDAGQLLEESRRRSSPETAASAAVIVVSCDGGPQEVVRLARRGLADYLPAGLPLAQIAQRVREIVDQRRFPAGGEAPRAQPPAPRDAVDSTLIGQSRAMREVVNTIRLIAPKRSTVLITGATGTGKELAARLIHALSPRAASAMVTVNCGAIPENLLEPEFFGHVKGAFTGAVGLRVGRFEQAHRSTLFLDEIGEMSFELQAKVLRAVQEREFQRVGSSQSIQVDVRVMAATNCDLAAKVRRGEFREDLYYRLNVVPVHMPALAEHLEDVPPLVEHFLEKLSRQEGLPRKRVGPATLDRLMQFDWPGNVRQLENALERAVVLTGARDELESADFALPAAGDEAAFGGPLDGRLLDGEVQLPPGGVDLEALLGRLERNLLAQALERAAGNKKRAADMLRLKRTTLSAKLHVAGVRFPFSPQR